MTDSDREYIKRFGPVAKPGLKSDWAARQRLLKRAWDAGVKFGWKHPAGLVVRRCGHVENYPAATRSTVA